MMCDAVEEAKDGFYLAPFISCEDQKLLAARNSNWGDRFLSSFTCIAMIFSIHADHVTMKAPKHASERGGSR